MIMYRKQGNAEFLLLLANIYMHSILLKKFYFQRILQIHVLGNNHIVQYFIFHFQGSQNLHFNVTFK